MSLLVTVTPMTLALNNGRAAENEDEVVNIITDATAAAANDEARVKCSAEDLPLLSL